MRPAILIGANYVPSARKRELIYDEAQKLNVTCRGKSRLIYCETRSGLRLMKTKKGAGGGGED